MGEHDSYKSTHFVPINQPLLITIPTKIANFSYKSTILGQKKHKSTHVSCKSTILSYLHLRFFWTGQVLEALKEKRTLPSNSQLADMAVPEPSWG